MFDANAVRSLSQPADGTTALKTVPLASKSAAMVVELSSIKVPELLADSLFMVQIHAGDAAAMAHLYKSYSRIVYSVALRVRHDPCAAEAFHASARCRENVVKDIKLLIDSLPEEQRE